jgi:DNA-binding MltR family transcriptional regulator
MVSDYEVAAQALKKIGLDLAQVLRDTHAETAIKLGVLLNEFFELALKAKMLENNKPINDRMFKGDGELATLHKKIKKARSLKLIDAVALNDADLVRKIRNDFGHEREKLHFDSAKIASSASKLSTYKSAGTNQDSILNAVDKITNQLRNTVK